MSQTYKVDKSKFGAGPWQNEPDYLSWKDETTGLICEIKRNDTFGSLSGYVVFPNLDSISEIDKCEVDNINVHGGITYSDKNGKDHVFGFDCAHGEDFLPVWTSPDLMSKNRTDLKNLNGTYKNIEYVKAECEHLAKQLKRCFGEKFNH